MLKHRLTFGPLLILAFIGIIWADQALRARGWPAAAVFMPFVLVVGFGAAVELTRVFRSRQIISSLPINVVAIWAGMASASFTEPELGSLPGTSVVATAGAMVMLLAMVYYSRHHLTEGMVAATAATLLAFVYVGLMGAFFVVLVKEFTGWTLLGVVLITKSYDIGAYFTGRALGRHKMIPWLSPGKTWEGLAGGVVVSALAGVLGWWLAREAGFGVPFGSPGAAALGGLFGLVGQSGDLIASLLKRDAGLKDYGAALPGFGGVMDIADSPLLVAPVAYWVLRAMAFAAPAGGQIPGAAFGAPPG